MNNKSLSSTTYKPSSPEELERLISELFNQDTPWQPSGLGSRLKWGPPVSCLSNIVSIQELNQIVDYAKNDLTVTVQAGMPLADLQRSLAEENQWLSVDWPWGTQLKTKSATAGSIGGLIARGLSGSLRAKYMGVRDQLIGIGLIRTDGITAHAGGKVVKNVAGYDLMRLLCGSWGSLALITEVTLRTQPIRTAHLKICIEGLLQDLESFRAALMRTSLTPEYCDWVGMIKETCHLEIGLASINKEAVEDQIHHISALATSHQVGVSSHQWEGPLIEKSHEISIDSEEYWLLRFVLPPSKVSELLETNALNELGAWNYRIAASIGVGETWGEDCKSVTENLMNKKINDLRKKVESLDGHLIILNQPDNTNKRLPSWLDSASKISIESIKTQFDPKQQLSIGKLPGREG